MSIKLLALTCGHLTGDLGYLMEGGEGRADLPIPAYLIEHPKGSVLFDTGMHPDCQHDSPGRVGARAAGLFSFHYRPGEEISARLQAINRDPFVPNSVHLAESAEELEFIRHGRGPWRELLEDLGVWDPAWVPPGGSPVQFLDDSRDGP